MDAAFINLNHFSSFRNMGRNREFFGHHFFQYSSSGSAKCLVDGCNYEYKPKSGEVHNKPLKGHLKKFHSDKLQELAKHGPPISCKRKTEDNDESSDEINIEISITKKKLKSCMVEAVTTNGLPLSVFEKSGLEKILKPISTALNISLNRKFCRTIVMEAASKEREHIQKTFANKMVSVKLDLCTRKGRHFIGINFQSIVDSKLKVVTATVQEMNTKATANEISQLMISKLKQFNISEDRIYSITTDNGANVIKVADSFEEDYETLIQENVLYKDESEVDFLKNLKSPNGILSFRCAMHTLQLAINDFMKKISLEAESLIKMRNIVNKCHTTNNRLIFKRSGKPLPKIDCATRWGSTYLMIKSLIETKDFLEQVPFINGNLVLSEEEWDFAKLLLRTLEPVYAATVKLQQKNLTAGEFYGEWLRCKLKLKTESLGENLKTCMENREVKLFNNTAFLVAVFLDSRYKCLLNQNKKK